MDIPAVVAVEWGGSPNKTTAKKRESLLIYNLYTH
jgi:hypothetical protein